MDKEQYIRSKFRSIISETIDNRVKDITEKLNLDKETKLYKDNEFDYVQEVEGQVCEQCGSEVTEGECKECGYKSGEVMEDDNKLAKITDEEIEDLLNDKEEVDEEESLYEVEFQREVEEEETTEGNAFTGALAKAKEEGDDEFEVEGKKYKVKESILYTESDLVDLIERLVNEEKSNISVKEPKGYKEYEKAHRADKKENDEYLNSVAKKMAEYLKGSSDDGSKYEMKETKKFPTENGGLKKGNRKKYTPSDAVDEYVDAFNYGSGQTGLRFDEIKPNDKNIEKYLKGDSTTGNAQVDEDGNALGNVVPSKVGDKFYDMYKNNLFGQEQADASYKRQPQPVDMAGEDTEEGDLKSKRGKKTAQGVLNKVDESVNDKKTKVLTEEFEKIQKLMNYNKKTQ
jgi:hypothetical protein